jgi:hypothetical protein
LVPSRRSIIVLASLVVGMTLVSTILLVLEPAPSAPPSGIALQSITRDADPERILFNTTLPQAPWQSIIIHDSESIAGSLETLSKRHERLGLVGVAYHFVINNGYGEQDGLNQLSFRWSRQLVGAFRMGSAEGRLDPRYAIGICLIGDGERKAFTDAQIKELVWLVTRLQDRFDIPRENVIIDVARTSGPSDPATGLGKPGRFFPVAAFRQQLLP